MLPWITWGWRERHDRSRMAELADALHEIACADDEILSHCRGTGAACAIESDLFHYSVFG